MNELIGRLGLISEEGECIQVTTPDGKHYTITFGSFSIWRLIKAAQDYDTRISQSLLSVTPKIGNVIDIYDTRLST